MLAPHELKNKTFSKAVRGYNPSEVNEYIDFIIEKYTEVYRENNELERKLKIVAAKLDSIKDDEESIRSTLLKAQKMGEQIISDASQRADDITASIKDRCDSIIADFKEQVKTEKDEIWKLRTFVLDFKKRLFDTYREHIQNLQEISVNDIEEILLPDEDKLAEGILSDVKKAVESEIDKNSEAKNEAADFNIAKPVKDEKAVNIDKKVTEPKNSDAKVAKSSDEAQQPEKIIPDLSVFDQPKEEKVEEPKEKVQNTKADKKDEQNKKDSKNSDPFIDALEKASK